MNRKKESIIRELKSEFDLSKGASIEDLKVTPDAVNAFDVAGISLSEVSSWEDMAEEIILSFSEIASEIKHRAMR